MQGCKQLRISFFIEMLLSSTIYQSNNNVSLHQTATIKVYIFTVEHFFPPRTNNFGVAIYFCPV